MAAILAGLAVSFRLAAATADTAPVPTAGKPLGREMELLIRELADERFRVREQASREIWERGETALPALREALGSTDPEQVFRVRELLRKIQLHITPETDPAVTALVERYAKASPTEKITLFAKMRAKGAWRQMLKLYAAETQAAVREKLQPAVHGVAVKAARDRLAHGAVQEAREFLEMAPADATGLLALAEFHRSQGTLEAELKLARTVKGRKSETWQLALERVAGNVEAARDLAGVVGERRIGAAMAVLAGDPLPWLRDLHGDKGKGSDPVLAAYVTVASKRWQGQKIRTADLEPLNRRLSAHPVAERIAAMNALFLLGEAGAGEAMLVKTQALAAFRYFDSLERIPEALKALGLDPLHPDYPTWVARHLKKIPVDDIEDQHEPSDQSEQLVALANFLERRGLHEEAAAAFGEPLAALAAHDVNAFVNLLGDLFGNRETLSGAPLLAKRIAVAWAGEDDKRWDEILIAAFGEDDPVQTWWAWLADLDAKSSRAERLDGMLALFGLGVDPLRLREKWLAMAWKQVAELPAGDRSERVSRIANLCLEGGDVLNSLKAWDQLPENERKEVFWGEHVLHLSATDRWDEAAKVFLEQIALAKESKQDSGIQLFAYAAAALRLAGHREEADTQDRWVDQLALGSPVAAIQIGNGYAFGHDYRRAAQWWQRAAREADPDSREFIIALKLHAELLLEEGKWKECAATGEVLAGMYVASALRGSSPQLFMHQRLQADLARALSILKTDRAQALALLEKCHRLFASDGALADDFFPALRRVGLIPQHDAWFLESWNLMGKIIATYPGSDNTRNTAAWFASRALRKLDEAEQLLVKALAANPNQAAYLDTMAEIQFAKGQREKALEWSRTAVNFLPDDPQLRRQQERFRSDPLPK